MEIFHERLKQAIYSKNMSQRKFGQILGVTAQTLNEWCSGKSIPNLKRFKQICETLEADANWLLGLN